MYIENYNYTHKHTLHNNVASGVLPLPGCQRQVKVYKNPLEKNNKSWWWLVYLAADFVFSVASGCRGISTTWESPSPAWMEARREQEQDRIRMMTMMTMTMTMMMMMMMMMTMTMMMMMTTSWMVEPFVWNIFMWRTCCPRIRLCRSWFQRWCGNLWWCSRSLSSMLPVARWLIFLVGEWSLKGWHNNLIPLGKLGSGTLEHVLVEERSVELKCAHMFLPNHDCGRKNM